MKTLEQVKKQVLFMVEQAKMNDDFYIWFAAKYVIEVMGFSNDFTVVCRGSQYDDAILVQDINNNTVLGLSFNKNEIIEHTYNFLANIIEEQKQIKEVKKLSQVMPTVMAFHLCKLLQSKANELSFDSFTNYYVENLILAQGNRGVAVDVTNFLGLKSNSQIDVIYKTLRSKVLTK